MILPASLADEFEADLERFERENQMPYVTSIERRAKQEGVREGLLSGIEVTLEIKFGSEGLTLVPEITQIDDVELLKKIQSGIRHANTIDELRAIYQVGS